MRPVRGMICITPIAPAGLIASARKLDSTWATAKAKLGATYFDFCASLTINVLMVLVVICEAVTFWMGNNTNDIAMKNNVAKTACLQTQVCFLWFGLWLCDLTIFMLLFQFGVENGLPFMSHPLRRLMILLTGCLEQK